MGSLLGEHTKWVLFYGNKNGFSFMGTYKMGSLLWEQTKWVLSPKGTDKVGFSQKCRLLCGGKGWEDGVPKKESPGGKKYTQFYLHL
jgi:hypothetical protein